MKEKLKVEITKEHLKKILYFILVKFTVDKMHRQGTSSKSDLIGGYIERWFNKAAEQIIFDELLREKVYKIVVDYFLYDNASKKDAPDILGLKSNLGDVIPFVKYNNGSWLNVSDEYPRIEVKVFRETQYLISVRESQMIDDYYVFIESNLAPDYLTSIFDKSVFNMEYSSYMVMDEVFIAKDELKKIIAPVTINPAERIGILSLFGIYTREEFKQNAVLCSPGINPFYFTLAKETKYPWKDKIMEEIVINESGLFTYNYDDNIIYLPVYIDNINNCKIYLLKKNKTTIYIFAEDYIKFDGGEPFKGVIKVEYKQFERSSGWSEYVVSKSTMLSHGKDSTDLLIKKFDELTKYL